MSEAKGSNSQLHSPLYFYDSISFQYKAFVSLQNVVHVVAVVVIVERVIVIVVIVVGVGVEVVVIVVIVVVLIVERDSLAKEPA